MGRNAKQGIRARSSSKPPGMSAGSHFPRGYRVQRDISFLEYFLNEFSHQKWFPGSCRMKGDLEDVGVH